MHELRVAREIIAIVEGETKRLNLKRVDKINLKVGELTAINPEALAFGFEVATADTQLAGTRLEIEKVPLRGKCKACQQEFGIDGFHFTCPHCESTEVDLIAGEELDIESLEGE